MPPKRRSAGAATSGRAQSTLSFNNRSRVTKQANALPPSESKHTKPGKRLSDQAKEHVVNELSQKESTTEPATTIVEREAPTEPEAIAPRQQQQQQEEDVPVTPTARPRRRIKKESNYDSIVKQAERITDAKVKAYWQAEEDNRLAPRIHQKDVHVHEKILRHFDLSSQYGPCIGTPRLVRWKRAFGLGLEPPVEVLAVLLKEEKKGTDKGVGGRQCGQLAYIDELAGGKVVLVE